MSIPVDNSNLQNMFGEVLVHSGRLLTTLNILQPSTLGISALPCVLACCKDSRVLPAFQSITIPDCAHAVDHQEA